MDTIAFKKAVKPHLDAAIKLNGDVEAVRKLYQASPMIIHFIAGMVCGLMFDASVADRGGYSYEEKRRIYDLVRLALSTDSSTS